jgi:hypothetical protein
MDVAIGTRRSLFRDGKNTGLMTVKCMVDTCYHSVQKLAEFQYIVIKARFEVLTKTVMKIIFLWDPPLL